MTNDTPVHTEDVIPVRSRVNWGAILGGSVLALAVYFLLTLLGSAIGLSIHNNVNGRNLAIGAVVWAIVVTVGCLFLGGFFASQLTTGENKREGVIYGLLVWGVVFASLIFLLARGAEMGFSAMMGIANSAGTVNNENWEDSARRMGYSDADVQRARDAMRNAPGNARDAANNPENRQAAEENATRAAWYTFLGTLLSMVAAAVGGLLGAGPTFRLFTLHVRDTGTFNRRDAFVRT
jgi:hypothetical protein